MKHTRKFKPLQIVKFIDYSVLYIIEDMDNFIKLWAITSEYKYVGPTFVYIPHADQKLENVTDILCE